VSTHLLSACWTADHVEEMSGAVKVATALILLVGAAAFTLPTLSAYSSSSASTGSTFATAASYSTCPNQTIAGGHVTGFESGRMGSVTDRFSLLAAGPVVDGTVVRTGNYSLKVPASGASNHAILQPATQTTEIARFAVRLAALPTGNVNQLFAMGTNAGNNNSVQLRYVAATQKLAVAVTPSNGGAATVSQASSTVTAGDWYVVEIRYAVGTTTHAVDWQINQVAQPGATVATTASFITQLVIGTQAAETFTANYDDFVFSTNGAQYPLGDGRVRALSPNGMGTHVGAASFTDDDGTPVDAASWQRLDEIPMNTTTDYIQMTSAGASNYIEITMADTTETCIRAAEGVLTLHSTSTNANGAKVSMFQGAQETVLRSNMSAAAGSREYGRILSPGSSWAVSGQLASARSSAIAKGPVRVVLPVLVRV